MSWIDRLRGGPQGIREAMQLSYERHLRTALRPGRAVVDSPHRIALYGALASRYRTRGISPLEPELWAELAPFVSMTPDALAVQALAEYVVYQELPDDARQEWLRRVVEQEIATTRGEVRDPFLAGRRLNVAWQRLIAEPASRTPASAVASSGESAADAMAELTIHPHRASLGPNRRSNRRLAATSARRGAHRRRN